MANGTVYRRGAVYWIQYRVRGDQVREPGGFDGRGARTKEEATLKLRERLAEIYAHKYIGPEAERLTVDELLDSYLASLESRGAKDTKADTHLAHVRGHFGERRAVDLKRADVDEYIAGMRAKTTRGRPYANATINRGLQALRAAIRLAVKDERLPRAPHVPLLREDNARKGFFERAEFEAILPHLSDVEADVARFGYLTGWRRSEVLGLTWENADLDTGEVRLDTSKNGEPRTVPMGDDLRDVIKRRLALQSYERHDGVVVVSTYVFHRKGRRIGRLETWRVACVKAGCPGRLFHDFRRTAARDFIRAGVPQTVAMAWTGHKTDAVFRRYNITNTADKIEAAERLKRYRATRPTKTNVVSFAAPEHNSEHNRGKKSAGAHPGGGL